MTERANLLIAADSYCQYLAGVSQVVKIDKQNSGDKIDTVRSAAQAMYESAYKITEAGAQARFGKSVHMLTAGGSAGIDEELTAFAIDAIDLAYERYLQRIRSLGTLTALQEVIRPCVLKRSQGTYLVRRSRTDKLNIDTLSAGLVNPYYSEFGRYTLAQLHLNRINTSRRKT